MARRLPKLASKVSARIVMIALVVVAAVGLYFALRDWITLEELARREALLRQYHEQHPWLFYLAAAAVYTVLTGLSVPVGTALTVTYAWLFGFWRALVLVSFASTAGATVAFLLSRYLFHDLVADKFGRQLRPINTALERDGAVYLLTLRILPVVPFFLINLLVGLTTMRVWTFWWASQLGMLPATCVYAYAGSTVPTLAQLAEQGISSLVRPRLIAALVVLGLFPLAARGIVRAIKRWAARRKTGPAHSFSPSGKKRG